MCATRPLSNVPFLPLHVGRAGRPVTVTRSSAAPDQTLAERRQGCSDQNSLLVAAVFVLVVGAADCGLVWW